jgi:inner membrane protein
MPNCKTHFIAGALVGATVNLIIQSLEMAMDYDREFDWGEFFLCAGAGAFAGLAPDILEPATSPNHRQFFHSLVSAGLIACAISGKHTLKLSRTTRLFLWVFGIGYLSHIALDCTTPKRINFL